MALDISFPLNFVHSVWFLFVTNFSTNYDQSIFHFQLSCFRLSRLHRKTVQLNEIIMLAFLQIQATGCLVHWTTSIPCSTPKASWTSLASQNSFYHHRTKDRNTKWHSRSWIYKSKARPDPLWGCNDTFSHPWVLDLHVQSWKAFPLWLSQIGSPEVRAAAAYFSIKFNYAVHYYVFHVYLYSHYCYVIVKNVGAGK